MTHFRQNTPKHIWYQTFKLRLVFPAVQENASAIAILPHFLEVCGRKLDNVAAVKDRYTTPTIWLACMHISARNYYSCSVYISIWSESRRSLTRLAPLRRMSKDLSHQTYAMFFSSNAPKDSVNLSFRSMFSFRLSKQIDVHANTMQKLYQALETLQAEAAVSRTEERPVNFPSMHSQRFQWLIELSNLDLICIEKWEARYEEGNLTALFGLHQSWCGAQQPGRQIQDPGWSPPW